MDKISYFTNLSRSTRTVDFEKVIQLIKSNYLKSKILNIRQLITDGKQEKASELKKKLPSITPSGVFGKRRKKQFLEQYNPLFVLDIDNVPSTEQLLILKEKASQEQYTHACFISPGGLGLKIFVKSDNPVNLHVTTFNAIADYYENLLGQAVDRSGKDTTRLCFLSYDPEAYYNPDSRIFPHDQQQYYAYVSDEPETITDVLDEAYDFALQKFPNEQGSRNNLLHLFSNNANRKGISFEETFDYAKQKLDLPLNEIESTIKSAYDNNKEEFGILNDGIVRQDNSHEDKVNPLMNSPKIPSELYEKMPDFIKQMIDKFDDPREKDVVFTALMVTLSSIMPGVSGTYRDEVFNANLFAFIIAPPAAGKGVMRYAVKILVDIIEYLNVKCVEAIQQYEEEKRLYSEQENENNSPPPVKPKCKSLLIPGNISYSKLMSSLKNNQGSGLIFESEADAINYALAKEWGSFSDILRKSFHHETISFSRSTDDREIYIPSPRLSICLSGTPNQVKQLIPSHEDGLLSRFMYYIFDTNALWKDVSPNGNVDFAVFYSMASADMLEFYIHNENHPFTLKLTDIQWRRFNSHFRQTFNSITEFISKDASSVIKRLGVIAFRLCMIFTALRRFKNNSIVNEYPCINSDLHIVLSLIDIYLKHSILFFVNLKKPGEGIFKNVKNSKQLIYEKLPNEFTRRQAVDMGLKFNLKDRAVDYFLASLVNNKKVSKTSTGHYKKLSPEL